MEMIRWLATNKVVMTVWGLGILAVLLASIFGGGNKVEQSAETDAVATKVVENTTEVAKPAVAVVAATAAVAATAVQAAVDTSTAEATAEEGADATVEVEAPAETQSVSQVAAEPAVAVEESLAEKSNDDVLMMAREAYWDNGLDKAASLYSELITREPTVIEHKGELGNVFWRQGYPKKAAELYADIAEPMISQGNGERVSNMVGFIGLFFPERASNIRQQLDAQ